MKLHHQQSGARLPICLGSTNAKTIFDIPEESGIVCNAEYQDMRIMGTHVHYGHLFKGGGINMSQERRQDYDTVINDVAILMGCMDAKDEPWVYMQKYDWCTRSFETIALKAGEEYSGEYKLVTLDSRYVSITIQQYFQAIEYSLKIITSCFFCNRKNLQTLSNKMAIVAYQLIILNLGQ